MKKIVFLLLINAICLVLKAQTVTQAQKEEGLRVATEFCSLLSRYSNGERTLDTKIYALCSGKDCSAYDNIKENKETTLRNYLMTIQKQYPQRLAMQITEPSLSNCKVYNEPEFNMTNFWGTITSDMSTTQLIGLQVSNIKNHFILFNVKESISSRSINLDRIVVYDTNKHKITAFLNSTGTYITYLSGLEAFAEKDYRKAFDLFEKASTNERAPFCSSCYTLCAFCSLYSLDYNTCLKYINKLGLKDMATYLNFYISINDNKFDQTNLYVKQMELMMNNYNGRMKGMIQYSLGLFYLLESNYKNPQKALKYWKEAFENEAVEAGFYIYIYNRAESFDDLTDQEAEDYLYKCGNLEYPGSYRYIGDLEAYKNNIDAAISWYKKAIDYSNNPLAMACLGDCLIQKGRTEEARTWLKKALEGDALDKCLENEICPNWIDSRQDIVDLLNSITTSAHSSSTNSNSSSTSPSYTNNNSSNSYSSYSSHYHYRKPFNSPDFDYYHAGLSVGYVQKQWTISDENGANKCGFWDDSSCISGVQVGVRIEPLFKYGFGIDTGLYYEYYYSKSQTMYEQGVEFRPSLQEHAIYLPVHLEYRLHFSPSFQLFFYGGGGLDYGISAKLKTNCEELSFEDNNAYETDWKQFNASLEYGGGLRINHLQFNFTISKGLIDMSNDSSYKVKLGKNMMVSVTLMY
jgi:tetratricopeptide (TPR) repeat protein